MRVYLDYQAATPLPQPVRDAIAPFLDAFCGNAASLHAEGFRAREALARAREQFAAFLGARSPEEIIFTSNGTEAVNLAIKGTAWASERRGRHIISSAAEQPAVAQSIRWLVQRGFEATVLPVDKQGRLSPAAVGAALRDDTILVCTHHANHDIGTIQPVSHIADLCADRGVPLFVDARASAGWIPVTVRDLGADLLAMSPQRFYGPVGAGVLYRARRVPLEPLLHGGEQEDQLRAGSENIPAIVGAGAAAELVIADLAQTTEHTRRLQIRTLAALRSSIDYLHLNGPEPGAERHPANLNISLEYAEGEALGLMLDVRGFAVATGSACAARDQRIPPVLAAIGLPESLARGNVILSFGKETTDAHVDSFVGTFGRAVRDLREMSPEWEDFLSRKQV